MIKYKDTATLLSVALILPLSIDFSLIFLNIGQETQRLIILSTMGTLGFFITILNFNRTIKKFFLPAIFIYILYLMYIGLSFFWSVDKFNTLNSFGGMIIMSILAITLTNYDYKKIIFYWKYIVLIICISSLIFLFTNPYQALQSDIFYRLKGVTIHAQELALITSSALIMCIIDLKDKHSKTKFNYILIFVFITTLLLTNTRAFTTFLFFTLILYYILDYRLSGFKVVFLFVLFVLILFGTDFIFTNYYTRIDSDFVLLTGRIPLWEYSIYLYKYKPILGYGFSTFGRDELVVLIHSWRANHAHNSLLHVLVETGAIGLSIMAFFLFTAIKQAIYSYIYYPDNILTKYNFFILLFVILCGFTGVIIGSNVRVLYVLALLLIFQNQVFIKNQLNSNHQIYIGNE